MNQEKVNALLELEAKGLLPEAMQAPVQELRDRGLFESPASSMTAANVARQVGQGATFFLADEIEAGVRTPFEKRTFGEIVDDIRAQNKAFEDEFPVTSLGLQVGGGFATGGVGAVKVLGSQAVKQAPKLLRRLAVPAVGAVEGGIAGFGAAEGTPLERLPSAAFGTGAGAAVGTTFPFVIAGGKAGVRKISEKIARRGPEKFADRKLLQNLERDGITPEQLAANVERAGPNASILEGAGPNVVDLARTAASTPGPALAQATKFLEGRAEGVGERVLATVNKLLGTKGNFFKTLDDFSAKQKTVADKLYKEARAVPFRNTKELNGILKRAESVGAFNQAKKVADAEGVKFQPIDKGGRFLSFDSVDQLKRGLDSVVEKQRDPVTGLLNLKDPLVKALNNLRRDLRNAADKQNPAYAKARAAFAGPARQKEAAHLGRQFMRGDIELIEQRLERFAADEKAAFLEGVARSIEDMLDQSINPSTVVNRMLKMGKFKKAIKAVFPLPKDAIAFRKFLTDEAKQAASKNTVLGGSPTARIAASQEDFFIDPDLGAAVLSMARGRPLDATFVAGRALVNRVKRPSEKERAALGRTLFTDDVTAISETVKRLRGSTTPRLSGERGALANALIGVSAAQSGR